MATSCWRAGVTGLPEQGRRRRHRDRQGHALFPAIFVAKGTHHVEFPLHLVPFFIGVTLCFLTVWTWIFFRPRRRWLVSLSALVSAAALGISISRCTMASFETKYQWQGQLEGKNAI